MGHKNSWSDAVSTIYLTFARPMWDVCWAIMTFLCFYGQAPLTDAFLGHPMWNVGAKLTYGAYLCHPLVIKLSGGCATQYYTFGVMDELYRWAGNTLLAF